MYPPTHLAFENQRQSFPSVYRVLSRRWCRFLLLAIACLLLSHIHNPSSPGTQPFLFRYTISLPAFYPPELIAWNFPNSPGPQWLRYRKRRPSCFRLPRLRTARQATCPSFTDSLLCGEVIRRSEAHARRWEVPLRPAPMARQLRPPPRFPWHALCLRPEVYLDMLKDLARCLFAVAHGFNRLVFVNGWQQYRAIATGLLRVLEAGTPHSYAATCFCSQLTYCWMQPVSPVGTVINLTQKQMGHACSGKRSMMLSARPPATIVVGDVTKVLPEVPHGKAFGPGYRAWSRVCRTADEPGHIGNVPLPRLPRRERRLFAFFRLGGDRGVCLERVVGWDGSLELVSGDWRYGGGDGKWEVEIKDREVGIGGWEIGGWSLIDV